MTTESPTQILQASESFVCELDGERIFVNEGVTRVAANSAVAKAYPNRFRPIELSFPEDEAATAAPGERRVRPHRPARQSSSEEE